MCSQLRLKSACAYVQSDLSLRCPHEEILHPCVIQNVHSKDPADAQADPNFHWVLMSENTFSGVEAHI